MASVKVLDIFFQRSSLSVLIDAMIRINKSMTSGKCMDYNKQRNNEILTKMKKISLTVFRSLPSSTWSTVPLAALPTH